MSHEGNQNAAKPDADKPTSFLHMRAFKRDKAAWVRAASRRRTDLTTWATDTLNAQAARDLTPEATASKPHQRRATR